MPLSKRQRGKKKIWYVRGAVFGRRFRERSTGTSNKATAERLRIKWEGEIAERVSDQKRITFAEAVLRYIQSGHDARFIGRLQEYFAGRYVEDIGQNDIDEAATDLYPSAAPATRNRQVYTPMAAILHRAGREITIERPKRTIKPMRRVPTVAWFNKIGPHCPDRMRALILFLSTTGARISEALRLEWEDVDLQQGEAALTTKTGPRMVDLSPTVVSALANLSKEDKVFGYANKDIVGRRMRDVCKKANAPYYSSHEFGRHYLATSLLKKGYSLKHVQEAGGWASIRIVAETYGHLERSDLRAAREEIVSDFGQWAGKKN